MKKEIDAREIGNVSAALIISKCKSATKYLDEKTIVRATWRNKPSNKNSREEMVITFGNPNYLERAYIKKLKIDGVKFPIKEIKIKHYPKLKIDK